MLKGLYSFFLISIVSGFYAFGSSPSEKYLRDSLPGNWAYTSDFSIDYPCDDQWWQKFNDSGLDTLISIAMDNNWNLLMAQQRMEVARTNVSLTRSAYYPTVGLNAGWTKTQSTGMMGKYPGDATRESGFSLGLSASWEVDLFGRIRSKATQAGFDYKASRAEYAATMVALCAELAQDYVQLRVWQAQLAVATRHISTQQKIVDITQARLEAGIGSMLDVTQAKIVLYSTQATIPSLENSIHSMINTIALLCGAYPADLPVDLNAGGEIPDYHQIVATGVPMELLRRRPDIIEAEMNLASAASAIGIAKKDFLPVLNITGSVGTQSRNLSDMFSKESFTWSVAPQLSWTIFSGMSRKYQVVNARRQMELEIDAYNSAVMNAVAETDNAMNAYRAAIRHISQLKSVVEQSDKSLELSLDLYKQGLTAFSNVSDAQLSYLESQSNALTAQGDALDALINLYKALGGGWSIDKCE